MDWLSKQHTFLMHERYIQLRSEVYIHGHKSRPWMWRQHWASNYFLNFFGVFFWGRITVHTFFNRKKEFDPQAKIWKKTQTVTQRWEKIGSDGQEQPRNHHWWNTVYIQMSFTWTTGLSSKKEAPALKSTPTPISAKVCNWPHGPRKSLPQEHFMRQRLSCLATLTKGTREHCATTLVLVASRSGAVHCQQTWCIAQSG